MKHAVTLGLAMALCMPLAAHAASPQDQGVNAEIRSEMVAARKEIRTELAKARAELEAGNIELGNSLKFGRDGRRQQPGSNTLPKAEITPDGDFLVDGELVETDARQRAQLLAYRGLVIDIAQDGIAIGEAAAMAAVDAVDKGLFGLLVGAMTGSIERKVERTVKQTVEPGVRRICGRLPALLDTQQQLADGLAAFRPYASLEAKDVDSCNDEVRNQFASR